MEFYNYRSTLTISKKLVFYHKYYTYCIIYAWLNLSEATFFFIHLKNALVEIEIHEEIFRWKGFILLHILTKIIIDIFLYNIAHTSFSLQRIPIYNALYGDDQGPKLMVLKIICRLFTWTLYLVDVVMYSLFFVIFLGLRHKTKTALRNLAVWYSLNAC